MALDADEFFRSMKEEEEEKDYTIL